MMFQLGISQVLRLPRRRGAMLSLKAFALTLVLAAPAVTLAQSTALLRAYQDYESAKAANKVADALKYGDEAVKLTESGGDTQSLVDLLRNLGDFAQQKGEDETAARYYQRALSLQESELGKDHPDLVPLLTSLADLS